MFNNLVVKNLNLLEDGEATFNGKKAITSINTLFKKPTIINGNLTLKGTINGIPAVAPEDQVPLNLLGCWARDLNDDSASAGSNIGNYSNITGTRTLLQHPIVPNEGLNTLKIQFTTGRLPRQVAFFADNVNNDQYIATTDINTGLISYLGPINRDPTTLGLVYDKTNDRFLALRGSDGGLISYNPLTGVDTVLNPTSIANVSGNKYDALIIGNAIFFISGNTISTDPIFSVFNLAGGSFAGNINWTGSYVFTGTQFKNTGNLKVASLAYEPDAFKVYFLLVDSGTRYIGYYQSTSVQQLVLDFLNGNFNITLLPRNPNDFLNAIVWVGTP